MPSSPTERSGTHFVNRIIQDLSEKFRIKHRLSTPYHPQINDLVERFNQTLCEKLAKMAEETTMWDEFIDPALMTYRTTKHATMGVTPFLLVYGREVVLPIDEPYDLRIRDRIMQIVEEVLLYKGGGITYDSILSTTHDRK